MYKKLFVVFVAIFLVGGCATYASDPHTTTSVVAGNGETPPEPEKDISVPKNTDSFVHPQVSEAAPLTFAERFDLIWMVVLQEYFQEFPDTPEAKEACLDKMLKGGLPLCLDDKHSHYIPKEDVPDYEEGMSGRFVGIGLQLQMFGDKVEITDVLEDSPAARSRQFRVGDFIIEVDGKKIFSESLDQVVKKIRGASGSQVTLTIERNGVKQSPITLARAEVFSPSVKSEVIDERTVLIKIKHFSDDTLPLFLYAVSPHVEVNEVDGSIAKFNKDFVIDLRGNPGGKLLVVEQLGCFFARHPDDKLVTTKSRTGEMTTFAGQCYQHGLLKEMRFVVLVNQYSASASEIFSGLMQNWGVAKIVGLNTYGKGSVQSVMDLEGGGKLSLTTAEYFVGNGKVKVNGIGIKPDVKVANAVVRDDDENAKKKPHTPPKFVDLENDKQLRAALEVLHKKDKKK